jgi:hypothetical protein
VLADALQSDALHAGLGALEQEIEFVGRELRVPKPSLSAKLENFLMLELPMLVDHSPGRMIRLGELGE